MQRKSDGPYIGKGRLTSSHDVHYATCTPVKTIALAFIMLVLVASWIASNNGGVNATFDASKMVSSYGTIKTDTNGTANDPSSVVQTFQLEWGSIGMAQEKLACQHFDYLTVGCWSGADDGSHNEVYVAQYKKDYPNIEIYGYIDLSQITSVSWMVSQWNTYGYPYNYTGIFLDDCTPSHGVTGVSDTQARLDTLLQTLKSDLPNMKIMANCIGNVHNGVPDVDTYKYVDIGCMELFAFEQVWGVSVQQNIDDLAWFTGHGYTIATFHSCSPAVNGVADTQANCQFALACYLCGIQNNKGYFSWSDVWTGTARGYYPIMSIDPGTPLGPYTRVGNILYRNFTNVNVQVDLNAMTSTITTP